MVKTGPRRQARPTDGEPAAAIGDASVSSGASMSPGTLATTAATASKRIRGDAADRESSRKGRDFIDGKSLHDLSPFEMKVISWARTALPEPARPLGAELACPGTGTGRMKSRC